VTNWHQRDWVNLTDIQANTFGTVTGSQFTATTSGKPLLMYMELSLDNLSTSDSNTTCEPIVDGLWAGSYGALPSTNIYREGVILLRGDWRRWSVHRIYPGIPAGTHTFAIRCHTTQGTLRIGGTQGEIGNSWGFFEID
jgi:hypothetical protein